jgi:hypothetical protein
VRDLVVHPRENDLVVGTHGRGLWITDVTPLQELSDSVLASNAHLFAVEPKGPRVESGWGNYRLFGDDVLATPNEPNGLVINYWLRAASPDSVTIRILDGTGNPIHTIKAPATRGLQRVVWNMRIGSTGTRRPADEQPVPPGEYTVVLQDAGRELARPTRIKEPVVLPRS